MKIMLCNLASPANPGDQAILRGSLQLLREYFHNPEITLVTRAISEKAIYEKLNCKVMASYPNVDVMAMESKFMRFLNLPRALANPSVLKKAVKQSDAIFLSGGGYFYANQAVPGITFRSHLTCPEWAFEARKPIITLPQSFGPLESQQGLNLFKKAMEKTTCNFYREDISKRWVDDKFPELAGKFYHMNDLAFYLRKQDITNGEGIVEKKVFGITVRPWEVSSEKVESYLKVLSQTAIRVFLEHKLRVRIIVQVQDRKKMEGDYPISEKIAGIISNQIGSENVELCAANPYFSLEDICQLYGECKFLIAMRLHSAILSFIMGTPAVVVGYQHKSKGVLEDLGLDALFAGYFYDTDESRLWISIQEIIQGKYRNKEIIESKMTHVRSEIKETFSKQMNRIFK